MAYAIQNKNGTFFKGFNKNNSIVWVKSIKAASLNTFNMAKTQAALFISQGVNVQRKPVSC